MNGFTRFPLFLLKIQRNHSQRNWPAIVAKIEHDLRGAGGVEPLAQLEYHFSWCPVLSSRFSETCITAGFCFKPVPLDVGLCGKHSQMTSSCSMMYSFHAKSFVFEHCHHEMVLCPECSSLLSCNACCSPTPTKHTNVPRAEKNRASNLPPTRVPTRHVGFVQGSPLIKQQQLGRRQYKT